MSHVLTPTPSSQQEPVPHMGSVVLGGPALTQNLRIRLLSLRINSRLSYEKTHKGH